MALRRWLTERYLTADPRALGAGRIALALVLLLDLARRATGLEHWYTNHGLLPNHTVLWSPPFEYTFSLFFSASRTGEAAVGFVACGVVYTMLLLGLRTRLAHVLSLVAVLSLHGRTEFVQNGGDAVLSGLCLWMCFLPTGRRYSLDAVRAGEARDAGDARLANAAAPVVSAGVLVLVAQLSTIYFFNALQKTGATWREGTVVHYMLHQECNDTWLAVWSRGWSTLRFSQLLTWTAWSIEGVLPFLLLSPWGQRWTRRLAVLLIVALHGGFAAFLNLGIFVPAMLAYTPNLLTAPDWDAFERSLSRWRLPLASLREHPVTRRSVEWLVKRAAPARPSAPFSVLGLRAPELREGLVLAIALCATSQALAENSAVSRFKPEWQPKWMQATATYLQLFQGWAMYSPDPPLGDMNIHVDAVTRDGRHVDPFNAVASPGNPLTGKAIEPHLRQNVLFFAYVLRAPFTPNYWPALQDWILRYPKRTGNPADAIVSFEAFVVEHDSPPPGERLPRNTRTTSFLKYPP